MELDKKRGIYKNPLTADKQDNGLSANPTIAVVMVNCKH